MAKARQGEFARVHARIKEMLVEYQFRPGEQLLISALADQMRVSSTPVRESLIRLRAEGLLETSPRRGFFARTLIVEEMIELHELKFLLLKHAIEKSRNAAGVAAIELPCAQPDAGSSAPAPSSPPDESPAGRAKRWARHIERAHENLIGLCWGDAAAKIASNANDRTHYIHRIDLEAPHHLDDEIHTLKGIVSSLQRNNPARAVRLLAPGFAARIRRMEALVKEGISRIYLAKKPGPARKTGSAQDFNPTFRH